MKKLTYLILSIVTMSVFSCTHEVPLCCTLNPPSNAIVMTAQRNGVNWQPLGAKSTLINDTLTIAALGIASKNDSTFLIDTLSIKFKYTTPGTYNLTGSEVSYRTVLSKQYPYNHTDPFSVYQLDNSFNNMINITGFNKDTQQAKGTFSLKFNGTGNTTGVSLLDGKITPL